MPNEVGLPDPALARRQAHAILAERRFHLVPIPRPLHGVLHAIGSALASPVRALEELVAGIARGGHVGTGLVWGVLAAVVLATGAAIATRYARRALSNPQTRATASAEGTPASARDLDRAAEEAERAGQFAEAVRLRFSAGLQRLAERELVEPLTAIPNAEVGRWLDSDRFDRLARDFDEIVYGGRPAGAGDAQRARAGWQGLMQSLPRHGIEAGRS